MTDQLLRLLGELYAYAGEHPFIAAIMAGGVAGLILGR